MGSIVISIDAELGWGFHDLRRVPAGRVENARWGWESTHELLDRYDVPATWAVVGHLLLEECDGRHLDHPTPPGWFERERTVWADRPDLRFAPDLVDRIVDSSVEHELAAHSFSHVLFGDDETTPAIARAECRRSKAVAAEWGLDFDSFVFPRNDVGHRDALAETGFSVYRGRTSLPEGASSVLSTLARDESLLVEPQLDRHGLVDVPASVFLFGFEGAIRRAAQRIWSDPMVELARRGIDQAAASDGLFHLWLHPNNLTTPADVDRLERVLEHVTHRRADGQLRVETMRTVGERVRSAHSPVVDGDQTRSRSVQRL
ncbi:polysaccharide deacetylase family protein [Halovivax cerinus]|uniref:Polysaccharide deacetylase family protein n=1 Tax=Halovivax cerinus TaxID=1487865 RepID=A0ABD5NNR0_9EURY|nr:polysaccharide deacetylase family protein [Halovivax cerinus]